MPGCSAYGCTNSTKKGFAMKCFPRDPERRKLWTSKVKRLNWKPTNYSYLCEAHFEESMWEKVRIDGKKKLKANAVPTLFCFTTPNPSRKSRKNCSKNAIKVVATSSDQIQLPDPVICDMTQASTSSLPNPEETDTNSCYSIPHYQGNHRIEKNSSVHLWNESSLVTSSMNNQLHPVSANAKDEHTATITNYQTYEEIYIKEEPLEETSQHLELYENVLQSIKKEECITDNDEQCDKEYEKSFTRNSDIGKIENVNSNSLYCVQKEDCISDDDEQNDKEYDKTEDTKSKRFCCLECNRWFPRKANLIEHVEIHRGNEGDYKCTICDKMFRHGSNLSKHMKFHTRSQEYKCSVCEKSFKQNYDLRRHMNTHTGIKGYQCTICKKQFTQSGTLTLHMRIHTGEKDFKCTICNKLFSRNGTLAMHMKIHTKSRKHQCTMCEKSFRQNSHLKRHMHIHNRENN